jgi:hypothetical protein
MYGLQRQPAAGSPLRSAALRRVAAVVLAVAPAYLRARLPPPPPDADAAAREPWWVRAARLLSSAGHWATVLALAAYASGWTKTPTAAHALAGVTLARTAPAASSAAAPSAPAAATPVAFGPSDGGVTSGAPPAAGIPWGRWIRCEPRREEGGGGGSCRVMHGGLHGVAWRWFCIRACAPLRRRTHPHHDVPRHCALYSAARPPPPPAPPGAQGGSGCRCHRSEGVAAAVGRPGGRGERRRRCRRRGRGGWWRCWRCA